MTYKLTEWQSPSGKWLCGCVDNLAKDSGHWVHPARVLGLLPADYIKFVVEKFHPNVRYNKDCTFVLFSWDNQNDMRKFKNYINKMARERNYQV